MKISTYVTISIVLIEQFESGMILSQLVPMLVLMAVMMSDAGH